MIKSDQNKEIVKITHVIFDLDGLIIDTERRYDEAYEILCQQFGKHFTFDLKLRTTGRPFLETGEIIARELALPISGEEVASRFDRISDRLPRVSTLLPGAERLITHLATHQIPIAIATGSSADSLRWKTEPHAELFRRFAHIICIPEERANIARGKPAPDAFRYCAAQFCPPPADPRAVLVFEDSLAGVIAANSANMRSIWIPDPRTPADYEYPTADSVPFRRLRSLRHFHPQDYGIVPFDDGDDNDEDEE